MPVRLSEVQKYSLILAVEYLEVKPTRELIYIFAHFIENPLDSLNEAELNLGLELKKIKIKKKVIASTLNILNKVGYIGITMRGRRVSYHLMEYLRESLRYGISGALENPDYFNLQLKN